MAIGKSRTKYKFKKTIYKFGELKMLQDGKLHQDYSEAKTSSI